MPLFTIKTNISGGRAIHAVALNAAMTIGVNKALLHLTNVAKRRSRKRTHALERSVMMVRARFAGNVLTGKLTAGGSGAPYAVIQDSGSGLYGPKHAKYPIRPKNKKALAWPSAHMGAPGGQFRRLSGSLRAPVMRKYLAGMLPGAMTIRASVMHPGVKPDHFLTGVLDDPAEERRMFEIIDGEISKAFGFTS